MQWFANLPWYWVAAIVLALVAVRFAFKRVKGPVAKNVAETAESLAIALGLVFFVIRPFIVQAYFIPSESMTPGLLVKDHLIANKLVYRLRAPRHGEIVVFKSPPVLEADEGKKDFIKRTIGVPGDAIEVKQGWVYINGRSYNHDQMREMLEMYDGWLKFHKEYIMGPDGKITKQDIAKSVGISSAKVRIEPGVVIRNGKPLNEPYTSEDPAYDMPTKEVPAGNFFMLGDNRNNSKDSHYWGFLPRTYVEGKAMFKFWPPKRMGLIR
jgi:signal peptidase I